MYQIKEINIDQAKECHKLDALSINLWSYRQWEEELKREEVKALAIYIDSILVGICVFQKLFKEAQINYFSIHPKFKRKGLGKKLLTKTLVYCINIKIEKILLEVSKNNLEALCFYKYFGFETINVRKNYYLDGSDALLKEKKLLNFNLSS